MDGIHRALAQNLGEAILTNCQKSGVLFEFDHGGDRTAHKSSLKTYGTLLSSLIVLSPTLQFRKRDLAASLEKLDIETGDKLSKGQKNWAATEMYKLKSMLMLLTTMKRQQKTGARQEFWLQLLLQAMVGCVTSSPMKRSGSSGVLP